MVDATDLSHEELVEDVREFVSTVEAAHPAPFVRVGGRYEYFRRVQAALDDLPSEGGTERELRSTVAALAAAVCDSHTFVAHPMSDHEIPVRLRVIGEEIRVAAVRGEISPALIGSRLVSVDGVELDVLLRRQGRLRGAETDHGTSVHLALSLRNWRAMRELLDEATEPDRASFEFRSPDGTVHRETLEPTPTASEWTYRTAALERPATDGWPAYRFLEDQCVAWLRVPSMTGYRERFENRGDELSERNREMAGALYRQYAGEEPPEEFDEVVRGLPSAFETFRDLATEMAAAETEALVVDVRGNEGGMRGLIDLFAYVFYGWDGVRTARDRPGTLRYSELYVENRSADPFEGDDRDWELRQGEYAIGDEDPSVETARDALVDSYATFDRLETSDEPSAGLYEPPELVVVTSETTFSAGLSFAATLRRFGGRVVGVTPLQAPTYYGDLVSFDLPNSGLSALTATSRIETLPDGPDGVFSPDRELTVEDWKRYEFDRDASVLLAVDEVL